MTTVLLIKDYIVTLSSENEDLLEGVYEALSFKDSSKAYGYGGFDASKVSTVRFTKFLEKITPATLQIPIGFLSFIQNVLEDFEHTVVDERKPVEEVSIENIVSLDGIELHDHQLGGVIRALSNRRGIIKSPTGSGKTEMFIAILNMLDKPSLVLFNRKQLAQQTQARAKLRGLSTGLVQGENVNEEKITMATIQSIHNIENIKKYKNLILDECHNVASKEYQKIIKMKHWERVYGFSATPVNPSKMDLKSAKIIANVGNVIYDVEAKELMDKGIIAKPKIYMIPVKFPYEMQDFNYREAEQSGIIFNKKRNELIANIAKHYRSQGVLILNKYVDQGKEINKLIPEAPFIWNEVSVKDRVAVIEKFDKGEIDILIASRILDEGIDIKNFKVLIIASAGLSFVKTIQRLGRGLRATNEKDSVIVFDFIDDMNYKLVKHSKARMKTYKMFGYNDIIIVKETDDAYLRFYMPSM